METFKIPYNICDIEHNKAGGCILTHPGLVTVAPVLPGHTVSIISGTISFNIRQGFMYWVSKNVPMFVDADEPWREGTLDSVLFGYYLHATMFLCPCYSYANHSYYL